MTPAAVLPTEALVPTATARAIDDLSEEARALYARRSCDLIEAVLFLGTLKLKQRRGGKLEAGTAACRKAKAYIERTGPIKSRPPYDPNLLLPLIAGGEVVEIPCVKVGHYVVDTHMLVWMRYPQVSPW